MKKAITGIFPFDASAKTVTLSTLTGFTPEKLYAIINIPAAQLIYAVGQPAYGAAFNSGVLTLTYDTTAMSDSDELMVIYEADDQPRFTRIGFSEVGSGLVGKAASALEIRQLGAGMSVDQIGGNLVLTAGTTAKSETVIRSRRAHTGAVLARIKTILSQRIANQVFRYELADLVGDDLPYTINSATSVTVSFPATNPFTAVNVGQSIRMSCITGAAGVPGKYAIASVSGLDVTFTVVGWPASGSGTLTLYGWNFFQLEYSGTTSANSFYDTARRGWSSGNTTVVGFTSGSPGHVIQLANDCMTATVSDGLVASNTSYQWTNRATRVENIPDPDVEMYVWIIMQNGTTAPASTTTWTIGFAQLEEQDIAKVKIGGADPTGMHAMPVQVMGGSTSTTLQGSSQVVGDVGFQLRANATGAASIRHVVSAATTNALNIKATAGRVIGWSLANTSAVWQYVKLHNSATTPTAGAGVVITIAIPPSSVVHASYPVGIGFSAGIGHTIVTDAADAGTTATTLGAVIGDLFYA